MKPNNTRRCLWHTTCELSPIASMMPNMCQYNLVCYNGIINATARKGVMINAEEKTSGRAAQRGQREVRSVRTRRQDKTVEDDEKT